MAGASKEKRQFSYGCYYEMKPGATIEEITATVEIRWYACFPLLWKTMHKMYDFKWYQYPWLIWTLIKHSFCMLLKDIQDYLKGEVK